MPPRIKSILELRRELAAKERQLGKLLAQRRKIEASLEALDRKIIAIGGDIPSGSLKRSRRGRPPGVAPRGRGTGKSLAEHICEVLAKAPKGMRAREVREAVMAAGYTSRSKEFDRIVAATLRKTPGIKRVSRGLYRLAKRK